ncbi:MULTISPECIES: ParA family protein [unclassified Paenibacillus]|uniref:ParA family protein n=1 Tax=Paenibacillus provencensis TaxID=441151 RepID=A0ABW3Q9Y5_9BACL|nr:MULTISPECIES: ParA family protein [unclassified Paenibacillus]MCM3131109.1 ParA family protein [Paenibacillus sp. MER 78]SDX69820.1 chromosome partitioning protein [Paenibacillus sp. PDC88]SFS90109.1 chromosome partitioning protein [Paenibacillus sp. 453mf]
MGTTISIGVQKGGVGKSSTTCITSYLLAERGYKVLTVDFDSQGNTTQILSGKDIYQFEEQTVLDAIVERDPEKYIVNVRENLDLLPADDILSTLGNRMNEMKRHVHSSLQETLEIVKDRYDFIVIDQPPNLGDLSVSALVASDYVVVMLQSEPLCFKAVPRYLQLVELIKTKISPQLNLAGILPSMSDTRTKIDTSIIDQAREDYGNWMFETVIKRRNRIKEFSILGIQNSTREDRDALEQYQLYLEELLTRVEKGAI